MSKPATQTGSAAAASSLGPSSSSSSSPSASAPANALEKPQHYTYLKEFRTEQCPLFVQHKCTQHRPFTCFHWHFLNQRRRRPIRRRDGTFNYSPDVYCLKYDEGSGACLDGDECPFLHRTAGDTERRYHLRYYKTGSCIHETDSKGHCSKNGPHCAFAHGSHDLRSPVYDIREVQSLETPAGSGLSDAGAGDGQSGLVASTALIEKILSEEPRWQDNGYVLSHYKTELCKKPPRLCRQGYACPYYHNSKDRRRCPHKHKYRALPCPSVKHSDEWGDPSKCESGESCQYCHTRTEQQFHPEIYKSTKCNDMQQSGSCPRGPFCAFAHLEKCSSSPPSMPCSDPAPSEKGFLGRILFEEPCCLDAPLSPWAAEGGYGKAPGFEREDQAKQKSFGLEHRSKDSVSLHGKPELSVFLPVGSPLSLSSSVPSSLAATPPSPAPPGPSVGMNANALPFYPTSDTVESVVGDYITLLTLHYITIHYITLLYITLHYSTLHYNTLPYTTLHYITLLYITLHYLTLHYTTIHYITLQYTTLHYITLQYTTIHYLTLHYTTLHYITLQYTTLHYITLHYTTLHYITIHYITLLYTTLHYNTLPYTTLHYITLHYTTSTLHYNTLPYTTLHYNTLHYTTLHYITLHYTTFHYSTLHYNTLPYTTLHYNTLHYTTLHYSTLHYNTLPYTTLHYNTLHYTTLHYSTLHYNTLPYTTLHYSTLHYNTLHYTTLHYFTLHYITIHYLTLHYTTLHYTTSTLHYNTLPYTTLHYSTYITIHLPYTTFHYSTLHYNTLQLHYITLTIHYLTLHYITIHYITLHYITIHYINTTLH
uniref:Unk zinc finger n=1 Tax=Astyanax mexicanus TaxID=7994 RepID=A0A3B1JB87_ASTMX